MNFPLWLIAGCWGFFAGAALIVGALAGYALRIPQRLIAAIMAFGSGVLISALSFDLMDEAYKRGGFDSTAIGFIGCAAVYTAANWYLDCRGALGCCSPERLRCDSGMPSRSAPTAIARPLPGFSLSLGCCSPERLRCFAPRQSRYQFAAV